MSKTAKHYLPDGKEYVGPTHKTGTILMTGKTHTAVSKKLTHTPPKAKSKAKP